MTATPRVSVIINAYNGERYVREAIDSVIAQSYSDWEAIVWDDRSTDSTLDIVRAVDDDRIHCHRSPNHTTLGDARNLAVAQARGEWLAFLDQDDLWCPTKLMRQMELIEDELSDELALVYGRTRTFNDKGPGPDFDHRHEFGRLPEGAIFTALFTDSCFIAISSSMIRKSAYEAIGGIPPEFPVAGDYYLFVAIAERFRARAVQQVCTWYRVHDASMCRSGDFSVAVHEDALRIVDRWETAIGPALAAKRRRVHHTVIAVTEALRERELARSLRRLLRHGSIAYLLSRPFARGWRRLRRALGSRRSTESAPPSAAVPVAASQA